VICPVLKFREKKRTFTKVEGEKVDFFLVKAQVTFHHLDVIHFSSNGWKALHFIDASQDANNSGRSRINWHIFLFFVQLIFSKLLHMILDKYEIYMKIVALKNNYNYSI
jgi:hypothetical protein